MKLLTFVDLHGSKKDLHNIIARAKKKDIEVVVCAGDFTIFSQDMDLILSKLNKIGKPVLIIHGNHEDDRDVRKACSLFRNLYFIHKNKYRNGKYLFLGWGGGGFSFRDKEFEKFSKKYKEWIKKDDKIILVTHAPPYKTKIDEIYKEHAGCKSIRKFIERNKPVLAVSGHLHECVGEDKIGKTRVINPGHKSKIVVI